MCAMMSSVHDVSKNIKLETTEMSPVSIHKCDTTKYGGNDGIKPSTPKRARAVPRQDSPKAKDPRNYTSFHKDQQAWSWMSLPDILYQLKPIGKKRQRSEPPLMSYKIHGRFLRDIPILPDNIASTVEEFRVEAWMRLDRRIHLKDITDRMHPSFRIQPNALQQRSVRFRQSFKMIAWDSGNKRSRKIESGLINEMLIEGIDPSKNCTRGITPGLINPTLGEDGGRILLPWEKEQGTPKKASNKANKIQQSVIILRYLSQKPSFTEKLSERNIQLNDSGNALEFCSSEPTLCDSLSATSSETLDALSEQSPELEFIHQYVPFDVRNDTLHGPLPVIQGVVADEDLPSTVDMKDIDLTLGESSPIPLRKERVLGPIAPMIIGRKRPILNRQLNSKACEKLATIASSSPLRPTAEEMCNIDPTLAPSYGLYQQPIRPIPERSIPESIRSNVMESMMEQCLSGDRYIFELPYMCRWPEHMDLDKII